MSRYIQAALVLVLLGLTGCATTHFHCTSEPSGASVFVRTTKRWPPPRGQQQWVPKGTTPCTVDIRPSEASSAVFLLSLGTNQTRIIELQRQERGAYSLLAQPLLVGGAAETIIAIAAGGYFGSGAAAAGAALFGVGCIGLGLWMADNTFYFPETNVHVDFSSTAQLPSQASDGIGEKAAPPHKR